MEFFERVCLKPGFEMEIDTLDSTILLSADDRGYVVPGAGFPDEMMAVYFPAYQLAIPVDLFALLPLPR